MEPRNENIAYPPRQRNDGILYVVGFLVLLIGSVPILAMLSWWLG
ncbi:hypothetical protein [Sphingomonas spermidinifaciens]|nr:hypothetical protein [Sphingomonas spermidinifaciens]